MGITIHCSKSDFRAQMSVPVYYDIGFLEYACYIIANHLGPQNSVQDYG